ncbi:MAG TPA: hypothetical protein VK181_09695 [Rhizobium sp.]|nr:hypothetical protein [Rhizobium sp.]
MAYEIGTATDHADLWDKLISFLTTNEELVYDNQQWEVAWEAPTGAANPTDIVLKGPGLADADQIFVGLRRIDNVPNDASEIRMVGMTGVIPTADTYDTHVNTTPRPVRTFLRANPMNYWFVANGRRFMAVIKVSSVYEALYGGFFLPYGDPITYSYPLFIGGSAGFGGNNAAVDWRSTAGDHANFPLSGYDSNSQGYEPSAWALSPSGDWLRCAGTGNGGTNGVNDANIYLAPRFFGTGFQISEGITGSNYGYEEMKRRVIEALGGGYCLTPITLVQQNPSDQTYGVLDGVYHAPGRGNSAENIITVDGLDHLVVQNTFRTSLGDFWAMQIGAP